MQGYFQGSAQDAAPGPAQGSCRVVSGTIRAGALHGMEPLLAQRGAAGRALCERSGVDPAVLSRPEQRIGWHRYLELLDRAAAITGDEAFGLRLGYRQSVASLGRVGDIAWSAGTVAEAVAAVSRSMFLHQDAASLTLDCEQGLARVGYRCGDTAPAAARQDAELSLAKMLSFARTAMNRPDWSPSAVHFRHRAGSDAARRLFGAPVLYGQAEDAILFPRALLAAPVFAGDSAALEDRELVERVRGEIAALMDRGTLSASCVALRLGLGERCLQRRLQARGQAFSTLVEEARRTLAQRLLADAKLSMTEISERLGYSEQSAFSRAFRRWAGCSPQHWRARAMPR